MSPSHPTLRLTSGLRSTSTISSYFRWNSKRRRKKKCRRGIWSGTLLLSKSKSKSLKNRKRLSIIRKSIKLCLRRPGMKSRRKEGKNWSTRKKFSSRKLREM